MELIKTEVSGNVLIIKHNRPDKFNSYNREMALQMQDALDKAASDKSVRAVYLTAEGKAFCAGQDLAEAIDGSGPGIKKIVEEHYNPIILKIRNLQKPVVCGVNGVAAGAGANIALACDIVVAASSAAFIQAFSKIGLIPDSGGTYYLPRLIGLQRSAALMMLGDKVTAPEALQMGMIYKSFDDAVMQQEAIAIAVMLSNMPTKGLWLTKKLLNESFINNLDDQLISEGKAQVEAAATHDFNEGVKAFLEKRKPVFKGE